MSEECLTWDLVKTCRTCLSQNDDMHPINNSIKTAQNNNFIIKDMLSSCTQLQISDEDGLPSQICLKCVCRVSDAYLFKQNCEKSENTLRDYISSKVNTETQITQEESINNETFKDNVINLIQLAVHGSTINDPAIDTSNELIDCNTRSQTSESPIWDEVNSINEESIANNSLEIVQIAQAKTRRKRKKKPVQLGTRVRKMVNIAPKQYPFNSSLPYCDQEKFLTINAMIGNKSSKITKLTKLPETLEIKDKCKICGIYFLNELELNSHVAAVHELNDLPQETKHTCHICNIEFPFYYKLNEHNILAHFKNTPLQCDVCLNCYDNIDILNRHKLLAHEQMTGLLSCEICQKKFDSVRGLGIHKAFHNEQAGEKICCKICDRSFNIMSNLTYHMRYHKTDVCQYCNHGFCNTSMLKAHMKEIHDSNKPYECSYCNKKFNIRKVLLRHKRLAHGVFDDIYFCGICKNTKVGFVTHEFLIRHIEKYHKLPENETVQQHNEINSTLKSDNPFANEKQCDSETTKQSLNKANEYLNTHELITKSTDIEENMCIVKDISFDNNLSNENLSELIDLTNDVSTSQITLNDDGTINIAINNTELQNIQVTEAEEDNLSSTQDFSLGDTIENTINVLKQEMFNDSKMDMGEYTINEINTEDDSVNNISGQDPTESCDPNLDLNDTFMPGKLIDYDEEKQQYTIHYGGVEYVISSETLNQASNIYLEVPASDNYNNNIHTNSHEENNFLQTEQSPNDDNTEDNSSDLSCKLCNITFIDQTSYNDHVPKHNEAARGLDTLITMQESAVEISKDIKDGMIRINIDNTTGIVEHEKTDLIFAKQDYFSAESAPVEENKIDLPRYKCPKCDDLFTRQYSLNRHLAHTHNEMCLVCNTCGEGFNRVAMLEQHRLTHKNMLNMGVIITSVEKPPSNNENNEPEEIMESLYVYEPEAQTFACEFCDKTFQRQIYLERHRLMHLGINQPGFMCSLCNKIFLTSVDMQKHKRKHTEEYLQCNLCDRTFTTLGGLKYHLKTHTGTKNHKCPFCGKKFTANINLNAHIKTVHSEVRPHLCNICGKRYTTGDHLRKHMVNHTGERKFQCGVCGRDFTQNSHLIQHSWIHSGVKPYACKHCDNKYTSSSALKKHIQNNH